MKKNISCEMLCIDKSIILFHGQVTFTVFDKGQYMDNFYMRVGLTIKFI